MYSYIPVSLWYPALSFIGAQIYNGDILVFLIYLKLDSFDSSSFCNKDKREN